MKICVFGSSTDKINKEYIEKGYELCKKLALKGNSLVYGGGAAGLMGAALRGFKDGGAFVKGIIPKFFVENDFENLAETCDELVLTADMRERKRAMEDEADAFIIAPGGIGTYDEFFEILTLKQLHRHDKAILILNTNGYYDTLISLLKKGVDEIFINAECLNVIKVTDDIDEAIKYLENYSSKDIKWDKLKKN